MAKIVLNHAGIQALLKSDEVQAFILEQASGIGSRCGAGYETDVYMAPSRVISSVYTTDKKAIQDNLENNTLLKAVSG